MVHECMVYIHVHHEHHEHHTLNYIKYAFILINFEFKIITCNTCTPTGGGNM